jgi:hypothetical protein
MNLKQQNKITYSLVIEKDSKPVNDLENYVGAKGHSVIIKKGTLEYIHTHPGEAANMSMEGMLIAKWVTQCPLLNKKIK